MSDAAERTGKGKNAIIVEALKTYGTHSSIVLCYSGARRERVGAETGVAGDGGQGHRRREE
jgi:hypothetical protein